MKAYQTGGIATFFLLLIGNFLVYAIYPGTNSL